MIGQCLSNKNESATVSKSKKFLDLNKAVVEIHEYVLIWALIQQIELEDNREDNIIWRWMEDGEYTSKSVHHIQFKGTLCKLKIMPIWKAKAELKCRFFA